MLSSVAFVKVDMFCPYKENWNGMFIYLYMRKAKKVYLISNTEGNKNKKLK